MTRKTRKNRQHRKPKVNWQKECETAIILNELLHPPEEVDDDIEELDPIEFLNDLRDYITEYIEDRL